MEPRADLIHTKTILDKTFCNDLIEWFESMPHQKQLEEGKRDDCCVDYCIGHEYFLDNFYSKIQKQLKQFSAEFHNCYLQEVNVHHHRFIGWKMQKSSPEHIGFTGWHCERWPDAIAEKEKNGDGSSHINRRHAVWMIYLNDVDGGCTDFKYQNISMQPEAGKLVIWPAYYTHVHRANPDIRSDKYILTGWIVT